MNSLLSARKFLALPEKLRHKHAALLLRKAYLDESQFSDYQKVEKFLSLPALPYTKEALSDRYHYHLHVATISLKESHFLPRVRHLDSLSCEPFLPIDIYLDNLRSAHNIGSIIRTTEAFRLGEIHFSTKTPYIDHVKVEKSAMGSSELVTCHPKSSLDRCKRPLIAIETHEKATSLYTFTFPKSCTLLFGNEEYGLSEHSLEEADFFVQIPLIGTKNSLNVASAFALIAGEIRRQVFLAKLHDPAYSY